MTLSPDVLLAVKMVLLALLAGAIIIGHKKYNFHDDNIIEKIVETEIKNETGLAINLEDDSKPSS